MLMFFCLQPVQPGISGATGEPPQVPPGLTVLPRQAAHTGSGRQHDRRVGR